MSIIVQKFGGSSLADAKCIERCAQRAVKTFQEGHQVVVVVSAMGDTTDRLANLATQITGKPSKREMDMLLATGEQVSIALMSMALDALGVDAVSMTGRQIGLVTDQVHTKARIRSIDTDRLKNELDSGRIVVVAGFQGVSEQDQITTLGRGGSDTTAVAIAAALGVKSGSGGCEIYTDVDGVYTADPRRVRNARKLDQISYDEMLELASLGASVMNSRAVVFGQKYDVPIHVRSSSKPDEGTIITKETPAMEDIKVVGCALTPDLGRLSLRGIPNKPGIQALIFGHLSDAGVLIDDIMQTEIGDTATISFTVEHQDLAEVKPSVQKALEEIGSGELAIEVGLAKVSAVGLGMRTHTGVAAEMFSALGKAGIHINNITTSEIKISCIVPKEHGDLALQVVHDAFGLDQRDQSSDSSKTINKVRKPL
ncbi:MAG: aspartate kinase [Planctomycetes bacterium]|nr:aspartate kinase [Planctomycetota bacterium]